MTIATAADLSADIDAIDLASQAGNGSGAHYTIALAAGATLTEAADIDAINLKGADTLTIEGDGAVLDGANAHRGLFVYQGAVTIEDLTIENAAAVGGAGGAGGVYGGGGGGGAGLGGGLFLANDAAHGAGPANVTLDGVTFSADSADGGEGGASGGGYGGDGGGMGGAGGDFRGGGGGIDAMGGIGWPGWPNPVIYPPQSGLVPGAASGGRGGAGESGGVSGGGGGAANAYQIGSSGGYEHFGGGGGGIGGVDGNSSGDLSHFIGGDGGFGGGGGWAGGNGGFGGGGASTRREGIFAPPGVGGFGGGGAGDSGGAGVSGGFGAGNGGVGGGGGLGAGGDIFVMQGASLTIAGGDLSGGSVAGGAGGAGGGAGQAFGGGIFLQGDGGVTLAPAAGTAETISDVVADQTGSGGAGANTGAGWLVVDGAGTVDLTAANTFTGGIEIDSGILELANATSGDVIFQQGVGSLVLDQPANFSGTISTGAVPQGAQYTVLLQGVSHSSVTSYSYSGGVLTIDTTQGGYAFNFAGSYQTSNFSLAAGPRQPSTLSPSLQITVRPDVVHPNDLALSGDATGPYNFIDMPNFVASYGVLINAFGANQQAAQNWFNAYEPTEQRVQTFDGLDYVASYGDLINALKSAGSEQAVLDAGATHFINSGYHEGRSTTFNSLDYIASYGDLINAFGANGDAGAYQYIEYGANGGRTTTFDGLDYIASYGDLINALGANEQAGATHFIDNGYQEARKTTFDGLAYIAKYTDLMKAFGANNDAGATHYINNGFSEGRSTRFNVGAYESEHPDLIGKYASKNAFLTAYIDTYKATGTFLT